jgi:hypothetical protein
MSEADVTDHVPGEQCGVRAQRRCTVTSSACALTLIRDLDGGGTIHNQLPGGVRLILPSLADPWLPGLEPIYGEPVSVHPPYHVAPGYRQDRTERYIALFTAIGEGIELGSYDVQVLGCSPRKHPALSPPSAHCCTGSVPSRCAKEPRCVKGIRTRDRPRHHHPGGIHPASTAVTKSHQLLCRTGNAVIAGEPH